MQIKKNPKVDLNRNSSLYFVIGLSLVLFLTWRGLEHKTYDKKDLVVQSMNVLEEIKEDLPKIERLKTPPPPPPPAAPEIIEVVEDDEEIEETIIESTESDQESTIDAPIEVDDIELYQVEEEVSVPFSVIEDIPIFPGCEDIKIKAEQRGCFEKKIKEHVAKEFKYPEIALEMGTQGRVYVQFLIDSKGYVSNIRVRGPDKHLENEATRIIAAIPRMTPGRQRGRAVKVPYSIPINFKLAEQ